MIRRTVLPVLAGLVASCAAPLPPVPPAVAPPVARGSLFGDLPGWSGAHLADAMPALLRGCARLALTPPDQVLGGEGPIAARAGHAANWTAVCATARNVPPGDEGATRAFLQDHFDLQPLTDPTRPDGLFTGYDEPELQGSRERTRVFQTAVLKKPSDLVEQAGPDGVRRFGRIDDGQMVPYSTRAEIDAGALRGQRLDLVYLKSPIDLFFLQVQGAGRIVLPHGEVVRVGYAAGNGQPYVPIGRALAERGDIAPDDVSAETIRAWLKSHRRDARSVMELNPSYTFFREVPNLSPDAGPLGTLGVQLEPMRSIAVDPRQIPLGAPVWVDTMAPDGAKVQTLMLAQDTGSAINGTLRGDIFFGWDTEAADKAARMQSPGRAWLLIPRRMQGGS